MKKITQKLFFLMLSVLSMSAFAQVTATGTWSPIGDVLIQAENNDNDNGDGVNDGALRINGQSAVVGQGALFTFDGTMEDGTNYAVVSTMYNFTGNFARVRVSLHNKTDDLELAVYDAAGTVLNGSNQEELVSFDYTAGATDVGDVLELRYVRNDDGNAVRDFWIDNASLNGAFVGPTPVSSAGTLTGIGDVSLSVVTDDGDNGDGVADGALFVDGQSAVVGQGVAFSFTETMVEGRGYTILTNMYNLGSSFCRVRVSLHNTTDDTEIAVYDDAGTVLNGSNPVEMVVFSGIADATDAGDVLELRYVRVDNGNTARNFSVDNATINGAAINITVLSVSDDVLSKAISIYPNPVRETLNISKQDASINIKSTTLLDITGKEVYKTGSVESIDVSKYAPGLYLLKLESQEGGVSTKKVVIK